MRRSSSRHFTVAPPSTSTAGDRVPYSLREGTPRELREELVELLGAESVLTEITDLVRYASDASPYRLIPKAVIVPRTNDDLAKLLRFAVSTGVGVGFRSGGTSLNGQSQSSGLLADVRRHFRGVEVMDDGRRVRALPGTTVASVNRSLATHGRRIGPDPASVNAATVGGVIANNAGGMRNGVATDCAHTLSSIHFLLASGTEIDTADPSAEATFAAREPALAQGLMEIQREILEDGELADRLRRKYRIRNTTGYRLAAFVEAETPLEIFRRLLVGSEGTLAVTLDATFDTIALPALTTVTWLHLPDIPSALAKVAWLVDHGARAVELMMGKALTTAAGLIQGTPSQWKALAPLGGSLLVEFGGSDGAELDAIEASLEVEFAALVTQPVLFSRDDEAKELSWSVREGMLGLVALFRSPGSALITEDVCVEPDRLGDLCLDILEMQRRWGFLEGVAGHAAFGNLHFMLTPDLTKEEDTSRYAGFMEELVELVTGKYDGSLKAEHGTGLNMAPFVEREWGAKVMGMMRRLKALADPSAILSPGVLINDDPEVHLRSFKSYPDVEASIASCIECGFCDPVCPSRNHTWTPRERIAIRREMSRQGGDGAVYHRLAADFLYSAVDTCVADGSCSMACPVRIDTGSFVKELRGELATARQRAIATRLAASFGAIEGGLRSGVSLLALLSRVVGIDATQRALDILREVVNLDAVRTVPTTLPSGRRPSAPPTQRAGAAAVYLPSCTNRILGTSDASLDPVAALVEVSSRASKPVWIPEDLVGSCCGLPWESKGYGEAGTSMRMSTVSKMMRWFDGGRLPVIIDASSCTHALQGSNLPAGLTVLDSIEWIHDHILPKLEVVTKVGPVVLHPTCAVKQMHLQRKLRSVIDAVSEEVVVPNGMPCCGTGGDRGLVNAALGVSAVGVEYAEIDLDSMESVVSSNRTCELGLEQSIGRRCDSFLTLVERATRP